MFGREEGVLQGRCEIAPDAAEHRCGTVEPDMPGRHVASFQETLRSASGIVRRGSDAIWRRSGERQAGSELQ